MSIVAALCRFNIQERTSHTGEVNFSRVNVFHLVQAAQPATVAKRFPLRLVEIIQRRVPPFRPIQSVQALDIAGNGFDLFRRHFLHNILHHLVGVVGAVDNARLIDIGRLVFQIGCRAKEQ